LTFSFDKKSDNESVIVAFTILISYGVSVSNYNLDYKAWYIIITSAFLASILLNFNKKEAVSNIIFIYLGLNY
ncbi:hypothetical protein, partial [Lactococcus cremoris]|uniref:hypothetical protein n=3 Tax=Streptococcaceae TaxID=1300 RepID=UPI000A866C3F